MDYLNADRVIIVGAGLAGLACANRLSQRGQQVLLLEGSDRVGGRLRTEEVGGYLLDRGFQVFLSAYPEAGKLLDLEALQLRSFRPGALLFNGRKFYRMMDVFRCPLNALSTALQPVGSLRDKLLVGKMRIEAIRKESPAKKRSQDRTTETYLRDYGFSDALIDGFFRPFYGGIFLERDLRTSSHMFEFTFRMFAKGFATIPAGGMQEIPRQLAARLPASTVRLNAQVHKVSSNQVTLASGEEINGAHVVVATDASSCAQLVPGSGRKPPSWRSVTGLHFSAPRSPLSEPIIALNATRSGLVNNVCAISDVAPEYAPDGTALISVSVLGLPPEEDLVTIVQDELGQWVGPKVGTWKHLRTDRIERALPEQPPEAGPAHQLPYQIRDGIVLCGDHYASASIEGAIVSGLETAEALADGELVSGAA